MQFAQNVVFLTRKMLKCMPSTEGGNFNTFFYSAVNFKFFFSSEISQLEIINQSVLRMFIIIALQLCFVYEPYEGLRNFCVVSV